MQTLRQRAFRVSERVVVIGPSGIYQGFSGTVSEVYVFAGMHRYVVQFENGDSAVFFSFELQPRPVVQI